MIVSWRSCSWNLVFAKKTRALNRFFVLPLRFNGFLRLWFTFGAIVGVLTLLLSSAALLWQALLFFHKVSSVDSTQLKSSVITPVLPGVNVPWTHLLYLVLGTGFAVFFHELGHALAAESEGVPIDHMAVFFAFVFPGAYVALSEEALSFLPPFRLLRIYCAGVWHNVVLCAGCWIFVKLLPFFFLLAYIHRNGPVVNGVDVQSPLAGHLMIGDTLKGVNGVAVYSTDDWILQLQNIKLSGYCVPFYTTERSDGSCLMFQSVNSSRIGCFNASDITKLPTCGLSSSCSMMDECMLPMLPPGEVLIRISFASSHSCGRIPPAKFLGDPCEKTIHFAGRPESLAYYSLQLTDYLPRSRLLTPGCLPSVVETFAAYTFSISASLALLNSAPMYYLDGEEILRSLLLRLAPRNRRRKKILKSFLVIGSLLFAAGMISAVLELLT